MKILDSSFVELPFDGTSLENLQVINTYVCFCQDIRRVHVHY
jgi:hypothetical protein